MPLYQFNETTMASGVESIDNQHKELFRMVNELAEAIAGMRGREKIPQMLEFLKTYVVMHFGHEEEKMDEHACPVRAANKAAHEKFKAEFMNFYNQYLASGKVDVALLTEIYKWVGGWLTEHICKVDTQLRPCVAAKPR